jgi:hypothetical protein
MDFRSPTTPTHRPAPHARGKPLKSPTLLTVCPPLTLSESCALQTAKHPFFSPRPCRPAFPDQSLPEPCTQV